MKYTKNELKGLIKECLIELLADGLGQGLTEVARPRQIVERFVNGQTSVSRRRQHDPLLDTPIRRPQQQSHALKEAIRTSSGGDPVMSSILADTARTTLSNMIANGDSRVIPEVGSSSSPGLIQQEQVNGSPEELFGEDTASKWAELAFAPSRSGIRSS
jgi:hypothetical protein